MDAVVTAIEVGQESPEAYPDQLDITTYDDGRWHYAASPPDEIGTYREAYLSPRDDGGWTVRIFEHVGGQTLQGVTVSTWPDGLPVDMNPDGRLSYVRARVAAEDWLMFGVAPRS